jgi:hypothetical protein
LKLKTAKNIGASKCEQQECGAHPRHWAMVCNERTAIRSTSDIFGYKKSRLANSPVTNHEMVDDVSGPYTKLYKTINYYKHTAW